MDKHISSRLIFFSLAPLLFPSLLLVHIFIVPHRKYHSVFFATKHRYTRIQHNTTIHTGIVAWFLSLPLTGKGISLSHSRVYGCTRLLGFKRIRSNEIYLPMYFQCSLFARLFLWFSRHTLGTFYCMCFYIKWPCVDSAIGFLRCSAYICVLYCV